MKREGSSLSLAYSSAETGLAHALARFGFFVDAINHLRVENG